MTDWPTSSAKKAGARKPRAPRIATRVTGRISGRAERPVTVVDISTSGCLVRLGASFDRGSIHDLVLDLPSGTFQAKVRVAESSVEGESLAGGEPSYLVGLQFLGPAPEETARLSRFLAAERRGRGGPLPPAS